MPERDYSSPELLSCLFHKQSKVKNLQFNGIAAWAGEQSFEAEEKDLARIERVQLLLDAEEDCEQAAVVLEQTRMLTSLDIHMCPLSFMNSDDDDDLPALSLLLGKISAGNQCSQLTSLRMGSVMFSYFGRAESKLLELHALKFLTLYNCQNYGAFLGQLAALSLDLEYFSIVDGSRGHQGTKLNVERFLRSLKSPKRILLALPENSTSVVDVSVFCEYASRMTSMKLQVCPISPPFLCSEELGFRRFFNLASSLEQLSISGIEVQPGSWKQPDGLETFLVRSATSETIDTVADIYTQDCLRPVHALKVLELTVFMDNAQLPAPLQRLPAPAFAFATQDIIRDQAKRTADMTFSTLAMSCPTLTAVVVKTCWCMPKDDYKVYAFLKSKQIDLYGHTTVVGMPVEPHMVKHYEPCSDILEPDRFVFA